MIFLDNLSTIDRGAIIAYMIASMLEQDTFLASVRNYLRVNAYSNANTDDLWTQMELGAQASGFFGNMTSLSIEDIMDPWLKLPGYPIVSITRDYTTGKVTAIQRTIACLEDDTCRLAAPPNLWHIWMSYYSPVAGVSGAQMLLPLASQELEVPLAAKDEALICNRGQQGYFRVRYDTSNILKVAELLLHNHTIFDATERAQLIMDASPIPGLIKPGIDALPNTKRNAPRVP